jgi:hypothetical protein
VTRYNTEQKKKKKKKKKMCNHMAWKKPSDSGEQILVILRLIESDDSIGNRMGNNETSHTMSYLITEIDWMYPLSVVLVCVIMSLIVKFEKKHIEDEDICHCVSESESESESNKKQTKKTQ